MHPHSRPTMSDCVDKVAPRADEFAKEFLGDLARRHPSVLGPVAAESAADAVLGSLRRFAKSAGGADSHEPNPDVVDLADSLMKAFARVMGRAAWTPALALEWNAELRRRGGELLEDLRRVVGG